MSRLKRLFRPGPPGASGEEHELFWLSRSWWRRAGQTSIGSWGSVAVAFAATVLAARALGPDGFGQVVLAISVTALVASLFDLTLEEAVVFHGLRAHTAGHMKRLRALIRSALPVDLGNGLLIAGIVIAAADPLADFVSGGRLSPDLIRLAALAPLVTTIDGTTGAMVLIAGRPDLRAWIMLAANVLRLTGVLVVVVLGGGPAAIIASYVIANGIGSILQASLAWWLGWRHWTGPGTPGGEPVRMRSLVAFGAHTSIATTLISGRQLLIPIVLGSLAGPAAVGLFRIALLPVTAVSVLGGPVRLLLLPEQAKLAAKQRYDTLWQSIRLHALGGLAIGVPGAVIGFFALDWLIPTLFSEKFDGAVAASRILLIAAVVHLATSWWKTLPAAVGLPQLRTVVAATSMVMLLGLLLLLGHDGSEGAALAYSLTSLITGTAWFVMARILLARADARAVGPAAKRDPEAMAAS